MAAYVEDLKDSRDLAVQRKRTGALAQRNSDFFERKFYRAEYELRRAYGDTVLQQDLKPRLTSPVHTALGPKPFGKQRIRQLQVQPNPPLPPKTVRARPKVQAYAPTLPQAPAPAPPPAPPAELSAASPVSTDAQGAAPAPPAAAAQVVAVDAAVGVLEQRLNQRATRWTSISNKERRRLETEAWLESVRPKPMDGFRYTSRDAHNACAALMRPRERAPSALAKAKRLLAQQTRFEVNTLQPTRTPTKELPGLRRMPKKERTLGLAALLGEADDVYGIDLERTASEEEAALRQYHLLAVDPADVLQRDEDGALALALAASLEQPSAADSAAASSTPAAAAAPAGDAGAARAAAPAEAAAGDDGAHAGGLPSDSPQRPAGEEVEEEEVSVAGSESCDSDNGPYVLLTRTAPPSAMPGSLEQSAIHTPSRAGPGHSAPAGSGLASTSAAAAAPGVEGAGDDCEHEQGLASPRAPSPRMVLDLAALIELRLQQHLERQQGKKKRAATAAAAPGLVSPLRSAPTSGPESCPEAQATGDLAEEAGAVAGPSAPPAPVAGAAAGAQAQEDEADGFVLV